MVLHTEESAHGKRKSTKMFKLEDLDDQEGLDKEMMLENPAIQAVSAATLSEPRV